MILNRPKTKWRFVSVKELTAAIAYWAVRLSPYDCPHNLVSAVRALTARAQVMLLTKPVHVRWGFAKKTDKQIKQIVADLVCNTPEVQKWNRCRKGKTPDLIFTSRYCRKPDPDRDFIDLHALASEVMSDFRRKWALEDMDKLDTGARYLTDQVAISKPSTK